MAQDPQQTGTEILRSLTVEDASPHTQYKRKQLQDFASDQIQKVRDRVKAKSGDPESFIIKKVVVGEDLAEIGTSELDIDVGEKPIQKVAQVPIGMKPDGNGVYCQILVSRKPRILILHYKYQADDETGKGTVEAEAPVFGDEEAEIEHFLTNMDE